MLLMTLGLILLLELISNNVIEPWLYGSSTGLSTLSIILAATFWTALWGPIGLILSTPLTVCLLVLGRYIPSLQFMEVLLGSEPVLGRTACTSVCWPTMWKRPWTWPWTPSRRPCRSAPIQPAGPAGLPTAPRRCRASMTAAAFPRCAWSATTMPMSPRPSTGCAVLRHGRAAGGAVRSLCRPPPRAAAGCTVGARWDMDALAAQMAAHSLALHGYAASHAGQPLSSAIEQAETAGWQDVRWLVLSVLHPQPQAQVRFILRRLRRLHQQTPRIQVVLALWNAPSHLLARARPSAWGCRPWSPACRSWCCACSSWKPPTGGARRPCARGAADDEAERLRALHASGLLQHPPVRLFHDAAQKAAHAFGVKYAQVSLVDRDWVHTPGGLLAADGTPPEQAGLPRDQAICSYVVHDHAPVVVNDVARDPRFADNPVAAPRCAFTPGCRWWMARAGCWAACASCTMRCGASARKS
jgi:hypothetical protein